MPRDPVFPPFRFPGGLAGRARGLERPGAVEQRAAEILGSLARHPKQRTRPAVLTLQLMDWVGGSVPQRDCPPVVIDALAEALGVTPHARRRAALGSDEPVSVVASKLGVDPRTVRRWRSSASGAEALVAPLDSADRWANWIRNGRWGNAPFVREELFDVAATQFSSGDYFTAELLMALAEVLSVANRVTGLTQAAVEVLHGGLREPDGFIAAGLAEGSGISSINGLAGAAKVERDTIRRWKEDPDLAIAYALNKAAPGDTAAFHGKWKARREAEAAAATVSKLDSDATD